MPVREREVLGLYRVGQNFSDVLFIFLGIETDDVFPQFRRAIPSSASTTTPAAWRDFWVAAAVTCTFFLHTDDAIHRSSTLV